MGFDFNALLEKAKKGGKAVADKTVELTEQAKVSAKIINEKAELDGLYKELGRNVYFSARNNDEETDFENALAKIDTKIAKIAELEEKLRQLKGNKLCGMCGKNNDAEAEYCSACGNKL